MNFSLSHRLHKSEATPACRALAPSLVYLVYGNEVRTRLYQSLK
jgi:hypothetical protein